MKQVIKHGATIDTATREEVEALLRDFARAGHVAFSGQPIEHTLEDWPVKGNQRQLRVNASRGTDNLIVPAAAYTDILPEEDGRGGISLINIGANACFVYLSDANTAKDRNGMVASGWLAASGGTWDGKIGTAIWTGPVSVRSVAGTTLVLAVL